MLKCDGSGRELHFRVVIKVSEARVPCGRTYFCRMAQVCETSIEAWKKPASTKQQTLQRVNSLSAGVYFCAAANMLEVEVYCTKNHVCRVDQMCEDLMGTWEKCVSAEWRVSRSQSLSSEGRFYAVASRLEAQAYYTKDHVCSFHQLCGSWMEAYENGASACQ